MIANLKNTLSVCFSLAITTQIIAQNADQAMGQSEKASLRNMGVSHEDLKPNILFVFCDQLRANVLGFYGDHNVKTPNIDRLAEQGVLFNNAISTFPVCYPYRAQMLTGKYPFHNGVIWNNRILFACLLHGIPLAGCN